MKHLRRNAAAAAGQARARLPRLPPTSGPVKLRDLSQWWRWTPGANWRHPEGPDSDIDGRDDHPVVHVSWHDAVAYCQVGRQASADRGRVGVRRARRAGRQDLCLGRRAVPAASRQCNNWQGEFPWKNDATTATQRTSPVKSYPPNGYGLYDMAGNVWQWCGDWYQFDLYRQRAGRGRSTIRSARSGPSILRQPYVPLRCQKGGSFLCQSVVLLALSAGPRGTAARRTPACRMLASAA